ncbi:MAG: hypothetical protein QOK25_1953 [Thermoleophilaceae bacterium]|jgi:hypothetical protein|nr:hypothetical protein [Thermoleophilaceae bacterium]
MGRRQRRRARGEGSAGGSPPAATTDYTDAEGNVLTLRDRLSDGTLRQLDGLGARAAATADDKWQRREELLFERLVAGWTIAGLPLSGQRELLGRYRIADSDTRAWVRRTIDDHLREKQPEALG